MKDNAFACLFLRLAEKVFVVLSLLFFTDAILPVLNQVSGIQINSIIKVCFFVIQTITILLIVAWWKKVFRTVIKEKLLWAVVGIALVSVLWSDAPVTSLVNSISLLRITLLGVYFAARYSLKEQLQLLVWMFGIAVLLSVVFALALPSYGVMGVASNSSVEALNHTGAWRGIYIHKNVLGRTMVLSALAFLLFVSSSRRYRWVGWAGFGLSVGLILLSTSKTALMIFITIVFLFHLYKALRWNYSLAVPFFITLLLVSGTVALLFLGNAETILGAMGRDITLTGRTELWSAVFDKIWQRPWLGYGYRGFWRGWEGESADVWSVVKWAAPNSHNGLLDLWLDLGLLGLSAFVISFIAVCLRAVIWVRLTKTVEGLWPLAYLTFLFLANITESSLFTQSYLWLMYVVITLSMTTGVSIRAEPNEFCFSEIQGRSNV